MNHNEILFPLYNRKASATVLLLSLDKLELENLYVFVYSLQGIDAFHLFVISLSGTDPSLLLSGAF